MTWLKSTDHPKLYPGTKPMDPEFGEGNPQFWPFIGAISLTWIGYWLETQRLQKVKA